MNKFRTVANQAATAERNGDYLEASKTWKQAGEVARLSINKSWCSIREEHCMNTIKLKQNEQKQLRG
ncbi:Uncharacterised protein [Yersinia frederiksenii]|nr:Uncharacterised protein [Yersinia frederiksenii]